MAEHPYSKLHKAVKVAFKAHKNQDRDGENSLPYITHPIEVLSLVRFEAEITDVDVLCSAVLHDVLEESDVKPGEIEDKFGPSVLALVAELTRKEPGPEAEGLSPDELWKLKSDQMMEEIDHMSLFAKTIKLADRYSNLSSNLKTRTGSKRARYIEQSGWILDHIDRSVCAVLWDRIKALIVSTEA